MLRIAIAPERDALHRNRTRNAMLFLCIARNAMLCIAIAWNAMLCIAIAPGTRFLSKIAFSKVDLHNGSTD